MPTVVADFVEDLRLHAEQQLRQLGHKVRREPENPNECIYLLANVIRRRIDPMPRKVLVSRELIEKSLATSVRQTLDGIAALAEAGEDLARFAGTNSNSTRFQDGLINDWNVHHLHLPATIGGKLKRKDRLLFLMVDDGALYFIDVRNHDAFADIDLLDIVSRNWPDLLKPYRLPGIIAVNPSMRDTQTIRQLRDAGVMTWVTLEDGTVLAPPGGGTHSARGGVRDVVMGDYWLKQARQFENWARTNAVLIGTDIQLVTGAHVPELKLRLVSRPDGFYVVHDDRVAFRMDESVNVHRAGLV